MKFLRTLNSFIILLLSFLTTAQDIVIIDGNSQDPFEGVALYNESKSIATLTDSKGVANLSLFETGEVIFVQYFGFKSHRFTFNASEFSDSFEFTPVSYTHLTLPTILLV